MLGCSGEAPFGCVRTGRSCTVFNLADSFTAAIPEKGRARRFQVRLGYSAPPTLPATKLVTVRSAVTSV